MSRYVVRPILGSQDKAGAGREGASGTVVFTETPSKARELGAARLGKRPNEVEVIEYDDIDMVFGEDRPLTQQEAAEIWEQDTRVIPDSWEH